MAKRIEISNSYLTDCGLSVFPIKADGTKAPDWRVLPQVWNEAEQKHKAAWKPFQTQKPTEADLKKWYGSGEARGIAIVAGCISGNLEILDFDKIGVYDQWADACARIGLGDLVECCPLIETPSGGRHLLYRCEEPVEGNQKLAEEAVEVPEGTGGARIVDGKRVKIETMIETRGEGGYVLTVGSAAACHPDNKKYEFLRGGMDTISVLTPAERDLLLSQAKALNLYVKPSKIKAAPTHSRNANKGNRPGDDFNRRKDFAELLTEDRWKCISQDGETSQWQRPGKEGPQTSATLNYGGSGKLYVFSTNAAPLEAETAYDPFAFYAYTKHDGDFSAAAATLAAEGYGDEAPSFPLTDMGNAQRLVHRDGDVLRYCAAMRSWLCYKDGYWQIDLGGAFIMGCAKATARSIYKEVEGIDDSDDRKAISKHAVQAESANTLHNMIRLAETEPGIPTYTEEWDTDPLLLNFTNGTMDFRTGEFREHRAEDMLTKQVGGLYDPDAECPIFEKFLADILPDEEVRDFMQRYFGYSATGQVNEQCMVVAYGKGNNGKSTNMEIIVKALGSYAKEAAPDLLVAKDNKGGGANSDVADLHGARFVAAEETDDGNRLAEGLVKRITGTKRLKARYLHKDFFEFNATHKLMFAVNHRPDIRGGDDGIWRRIKLVPFEVKVEKVDKSLPEKMAAELPGILAWIVRGCQEWLRQGLNAPAQVLAATAAYREEMDLLRDFFADCCEFAQGAVASKGGLFDAYEAWCEKNAVKPLGKITFGNKLKDRPGIKEALGVGEKAERGWSGIKLKPQSETKTPAECEAEALRKSEEWFAARKAI